MNSATVNCHNVDVSGSNVLSVSVRLALVASARLCQDLIVTDITNAYLNAYTLEFVLIKLGDDFGDLAGKTVRIIKALYVLRASSAAWRCKLSNTLCEMGLIPSRLDSNL